MHMIHKTTCCISNSGRIKKHKKTCKKTKNTNHRGGGGKRKGAEQRIFELPDGGKFHLEFCGRIHSFKIDIMEWNPITIVHEKYVPESKDSIEVNQNCIIKMALDQFQIHPSKYGDKLCIINATEFKKRLHDMNVHGHYNNAILGVLKNINTCEISGADKEGEVYIELPNFGIFIKRTT